jgi:hypothetical protein
MSDTKIINEIGLTLLAQKESEELLNEYYGYIQSVCIPQVEVIDLSNGLFVTIARSVCLDALRHIIITIVWRKNNREVMAKQGHNKAFSIEDIRIMH